LSDLSDLRGRRFVQTSETEKGQRLAEGKLKRISQGIGKIKACRKYENPIEFTETHKLWLDANHKPRVKGNDGATWNRLYPIPFTVQVPKEEQDKSLPDKLMAEAEGILAWAVAGAVRWNQEGLGKPEEIEAANREWRNDEDTQGKFIAECLQSGESDTESGWVYKIYRWWCEKNGERFDTETGFGRGMTERGFERGNALGTRRTVYRKTTIIAAVETDFEADQHHKRVDQPCFEEG
jgi:putative DNA primase/helicase